MNKEINQKVSLFLDDELPLAELDSLLLQMKQQPQLKHKMNRYQTISHLLSAEDVLRADESFLNNISQSIKQEPHHLIVKQNVVKSRRGFWPEASFALAASVALMAVIVSQQTGLPQGQSSQMLAQKQLVDQPIQTVKVTKLTQHERFKAYLQAHSDDLYTHGSLNYQPLASVANYSQK